MRKPLIINHLQFRETLGTYTENFVENYSDPNYRENFAENYLGRHPSRNSSILWRARGLAGLCGARTRAAREQHRRSPMFRLYLCHMALEDVLWS
jgi:hypothetical protein